VFLSAGDAKATLASRAIDAWAIWDPYLAIGERQDHDRVLITSEQVAKEVECSVASDAAIASKRPQLLDFIARARRANRRALAYPEPAAQAYAKETGVPLDIARIVRGRMRVDVLPQVTDDAVAAHQRCDAPYSGHRRLPGFAGALPHSRRTRQLGRQADQVA
jgi:sulfonate transport system substrate-binding protein